MVLAADLDFADERICKLRKTAVENKYSVLEYRKIMMNNNTESSGTVKTSKTRIIGIPEKRRERMGQK